MSSVVWIHTWCEPGAGAFRIGRDGQDLVAQWDGIGTLRASANGSRHEVAFPEGISQPYREKFCAGPVAALLRHLAGGTTLHASAVEIGGEALAFLGDSGSGKSTAAADLCGRLGAVLLADDLVTIDRRADTHWALARDSNHWLSADSMAAVGLGRIAGDAGEAKSPVRAPNRSSTAAPHGARLRALVQLAFDDSVSAPALRRLEGRESFEAINGGYVRFIIDDAAVCLRDLDQISRLSTAVPTYRLTRRRAFADLESVARVLHNLTLGAGAIPGAHP